MANYYCYLIMNSNRSYIGITNNPLKRLKQHNCIIKGGAKATRLMRNSNTNWHFHTIIGGFINRSLVSQFESQWKHPRTHPGIINKMNRLITLLCMNKWKQCYIVTKDYNLEFYKLII